MDVCYWNKFNFGFLEPKLDPLELICRNGLLRVCYYYMFCFRYAKTEVALEEFLSECLLLLVIGISSISDILNWICGLIS